MKPFHGTREEWCERVIAVLEREMADVGITMQGDRQVRVAVTPLPWSSLGRCRPSRSSNDGRTNFIDISTAQAEPTELVHTLLHELLHAFDDCQSGHRFRWKRWAEEIGIKRAGHERGPIAEAIVRAVLDEVGEPAAHVSSVRRSGENMRPKSQVRLYCPACGLSVHIPAGTWELGAKVLCYEHVKEMVEEKPAVNLWAERKRSLDIEEKAAVNLWAERKRHSDFVL